MAAVHRTILLLDVAGSGDLSRTNLNQIAVRDALYRLVSRAFQRSGIVWEECGHEDRGDGILVILPPDVPKVLLVELLPGELLSGVEAHNNASGAAERIRLRMALHAGEVHYDEHGVVGRSVNHAFRLLEAPDLKHALAESGRPLALITSAWFFDEVVWHSRSPDRNRYYQVSVTVKETTATAWICVPGVDPQPTEVPSADVPRQLPARTSRFVGRDGELGQLMTLLDDVGWHGAVPVVAIDGTAGVGKTTLATHWAHQVRSRFPDGQLYIDLRGYDPREPVAAGQVLHGFLQALGVDPTAIPVGDDAMASLYRSLLADRRMLIVLDNARSSDQVRPLLPAAERCFVLITSRNRLHSLTVREGAYRITLNSLPVPDAMALLAGRVGRERLEAEPEAAAELVEQCTRLPLALSIIAARAGELPVVPMSGLVSELRDEWHRLDVFDLGDVDLSIRAVFSWSIGVLSDGAAWLFRLLGVHPGPDVDLFACQAVIGARARELLNELTSGHLITEYAPGRFRFHDLLRAYAAEQATPAERTDAVRGFLDYYLRAATLADIRIQPCRDGAIRPEAAGNDLPPLVTYQDGIDWFAAECPVLLGMIRLAAEEGLSGPCWRLAWTANTFLRRMGRWQERVEAHETAVTVTHRVGDELGEGVAEGQLGAALARIGRYDEALNHLDEATEIFTALQDDARLTTTHLAYARLFEATRDPTRGLAHAQRAWELVRDTDNQLAKGDALTAMGRQLAAQGEFLRALELCLQAFDEYSGVEHAEGEADVLANIGDIEQALGDPDSAVRHYQQSLIIDRMLGDRFWEASVLDRLGDAHVASGDEASAAQAWRQSALIFHDLRHPRGAGVDDKLSTLAS
ncbi:MAG TPA: tetratricopeptide repeat protein [Pseudonocardiaceae bacterium]|nr:tetratricopeptide repeat protein [Pseudonocardiaceae bacterium]